MKLISTILFTACFLLHASTMQAQWETQPEFPGGLEAMISFIDSVRRYPQEAVEKKIEGSGNLPFGDGVEACAG